MESEPSNFLDNVMIPSGWKDIKETFQQRSVIWVYYLYTKDCHPLGPDLQGGSGTKESKISGGTLSQITDAPSCSVRVKDQQQQDLYSHSRLVMIDLDLNPEAVKYFQTNYYPDIQFYYNQERIYRMHGTVPNLLQSIQGMIYYWINEKDILDT